MVSNAKQFVSSVLVATALSGCVVVIPPPARNDPFQPPPSAAITIQKGNTHRMRLDCGAKATFQSLMAPIENLVVEYNAENLSPVKQVPAAAMRLNWRGPGAAMDVPFGVGTGSSRDSSVGSITVNGGAGSHTFTVSMPSGPDCGPVKLKIAFK